MLSSLTSKAITAQELADAYQANEVAADEQYKGKQVTVTGRIKSIGKDIFDKIPYVEIETSEQLTSIRCIFSSKDVNILSSLARGESIAISGTVRGAGVISIHVEDCTIKKD